MGSLRQFIQEEAQTLLKTLQIYHVKAGLTDDPHDLLHEVVLEALQHEQRFQPERQPRAWMLGIAANLIKRKQATLFRLQRREPLIRDLMPYEQLSDEELFDRVAGSYEEADDQLQTMLAALSPPDQEIIRLAITHEMKGEEIALALGIRPGTARVRLHRALQRLRQIQETTQHEL